MRLEFKSYRGGSFFIDTNVKKWQENKIIEKYNYHIKNNPAYHGYVAERVEKSPEDIKTSDEIPPLTKEFFNESFTKREKAVSAISCKPEEIVNCYETSKGSLILVSLEDEHAFLNTWESFIKYYKGKGKVMINAAPLGPWGSGRETDKTRTNWMVTTPQFFSEEQYIDRFRRWNPELMLLFPGLIAKLADYMKEKGFDPKKELRNLETVFIAGEMNSVGFREKMSSFFGAAVVDLYAATEFGTIAVEDKQRKKLLTYADRFVFQKESNETTSPLLITDLTKKALPMVKYRIGDLVREIGFEDGYLKIDFIAGRTHEMVSVGAAEFSRRDLEEIIGCHPRLLSKYKVIVVELEDNRKRLNLKIGVKEECSSADISDYLCEGIMRISSSMKEATLRGFIHPTKIEIYSEKDLRDLHPEIFKPKAELIEYR